jgi:hypothetical protein
MPSGLKQITDSSLVAQIAHHIGEEDEEEKVPILPILSRVSEVEEEENERMRHSMINARRAAAPISELIKPAYKAPGEIDESNHELADYTS